MSGADYLFQGSAPPAVPTTFGTDSGLPDWYQEYVRGIAGKASDIAGQASGAPVPQMSVTPFNEAHERAAGLGNASIGAWQPGMQGAYDTVSSVPGQAQGYAQQATTGAFSQPTMQWPQQYQQYMSPYTQQVVDNIGRLGARNFNENIMPGINASMIGSGQFGSTRNADVLGRAGRDASLDILGRQSEALQSGYGMSADIFGQDANRVQAGQQARSAASLGALSGVTQAGLNAGTQMGALTQAQQGMRTGDINTALGFGDRVQQLEQTANDTAYSNQMNNLNWDWNQLNNVNSALRGMPLNTTQTQMYAGPGQYYRPGALQSVAAGYGMARGTT